jgi:adenosylmethionine-8-amino-7-oxononanoate aminotransferase
VLDVLDEERILDRNRDTAAYVNRRAGAIRSRSDIEHFRNTGMIWAFDVKGAGPGFGRDFARRALEAGVLLRPLGSTVYWMPPYTIERKEIDFLVDATCSLLDSK